MRAGGRRAAFQMRVGALSIYLVASTQQATKQRGHLRMIIF
jgi:hypothetical protein